MRDPARDVDGSRRITVDGRRSARPSGERVVYIAQQARRGRLDRARHPRPAHDRRPHQAERRLYPVGRLDADTTGLILLTDDGELAYRLTHPSFEVPKTYRAVVRNPPVREPAHARLREGVELEDGRTSPGEGPPDRPGELELTIHEGRKRQVRRMCEAVGHRVETLERIAFGPLRLGNLPPGGHRRLTAAEVERLRGTGRPPASQRLARAD